MAPAPASDIRVVDVPDRSRFEGQGLGSEPVRTALCEACSDGLDVEPDRVHRPHGLRRKAAVS
jgi:uncharacterized protein YlaI